MSKPNGGRPTMHDAQALAIVYIEKHLFLPSYVKPLAKEIVISHFQSLAAAIDVLELAVRRTLDATKNEGSKDE